MPTTLLRATVLAVLLVAMTALSILANNHPYFAWDVTIANWVMDIPNPGVGSLMGAVSWPGTKSAIITVLAGTALATWSLSWRAGVLVFSVLLVTGVNEEFKEIIGRARPEDLNSIGNKSFPSSHVLYASLLTGVTWLLVAPKLSKQSHRLALAGIFVVWVLLTGMSRIYLEKHWPSDVLGAYLLGAVLLLVMAWAIPVLGGIRRPSRVASSDERETS